jgi:hypothetical protein
MAKPIKSPIKSEDEVREIFIRTSEACSIRYMHYPNVIGMGIGLKLTKGTPIDDQLSIIFYVHQKVKQIPTNRKLPRFIYARTNDGKIDRSLRLRTDVIELKNLKFTYQSGTQITIPGKLGTITMIFQNKDPHDKNFFLITCAHVLGDMKSPHPFHTKISSLSSGGKALKASTIICSTAKQKDANYTVDFDIALAQVDRESNSRDELQVAGSPVILKRFLPYKDIKENISLRCAFPASGIKIAKVYARCITPMPIELDGSIYRVNNLFKINEKPRKGDSGGLLYNNNGDAVGIMIAEAEGYGLFQPLAEAFDYLNMISPVRIKCFQ